MNARAACVVALLAVSAKAAGAGAYKCTDANGRLSFQQQPCPKDSTASKLDVGTADWVLLNREDSNYYTRSKSVDVGNLKQVGKYVRAPLRETTVMKGVRTGDSDMQNWFVYYDCAEQTVSQPINVQRAPEYEQQLRENVTDPKEWRMRDPTNPGLQKACSTLP